MMENSLYGRYRTNTFSEIFPDLHTFLTTFRASGLNSEALTDKNLTILYYELYGEYGNSHIASSDENQFKYKMFAIILNKGLIWQKNLETQTKLQQLTDEQILQVGRNLSSHAFNPGEGGQKITDGETFLDYINDQSSTKQSGAYVDSMMNYMNALSDVSTAFIAEFKKLFLTIVNPEVPLLYSDEEE